MMNISDGQDYAFQRKAMIELLHIMQRHWRLVSIALVLAMSGALVQHILFPKYVSKAALILRTNQESPLQRVFAKISGNINQINLENKDPSEDMMKILESTGFNKYVKAQVESQWKNKELPADSVKTLGGLENDTLTSGDDVNEKINEIYRHFLKNYAIRSKSDIIEIYGYSRYKEEAEGIAIWMTQVAKNFMVDFEIKEIVETEGYLIGEGTRTRERISEINEEIDKFRADPNLVGNSKDGEGSALDRSVAKIREELEMVRVRLEENELLSAELAGKLRKKRTERELANNEEEVQEPLTLRGRFIDALKDLQREHEGLDAKERAYQARLTKLIATMRPQNQQRVFDLRKRLDLEHDLYQEIQRQIFATRIYQISVENKIRDYETVEKGSSIRDIGLAKKFGIAMILALFISFIIVYIWEHLKPVVSSKHDYVQLGVRFLGSVPIMFHTLIPKPNVVKGRGLFSRLATILKSGIRTPETTAIQFLAARIMQYVGKVSPNKKCAISIVSCNSGEGKTLISNSLAAVMGNFGIKVLMIEGDTLRVYGENMFGIDPKPGVAEVLSGECRLQDVVSETEFENVYYCTRGQKRPEASLFHRGRFKEFIEQAKKSYDLIVVDTPAFSVGPEALMMAGDTDVSLIVASAHQTPQEAFWELVESLRARGMKNILGILNRAGQRASLAEAYYYSENINTSEGGKKAS